MRTILAMYLKCITLLYCGTTLAGSIPQKYILQDRHVETDQSNTENRRPQQDNEKNAAILRLEQEVGENGYHYAYETSNDIQAEQSGDTYQTSGAFAYRADDGQIFSVTFTAGEDGFRAHGDHLPLPPPTPAEILLALKRNERDEAAGIFDDGQYHPEESESDHSNTDRGYK